jgi:hypothetical protein
VAEGRAETYDGTAWRHDFTWTGGGIPQLDALNVNGALTVTGIGQMLVARKTADQPISSNTTVQDDTHLSFSVAANAAYVVDGMLIYGADPGADIRIGFFGPASATFDWGVTGQDGTQNGTSSPVIVDSQAMGSSSFFLGGNVAGNTKKMIGKLDGFLVTSSTPGTFKLMWAQAASSGTQTIMYAPSYMRLHRVA